MDEVKPKAKRGRPYRSFGKDALEHRRSKRCELVCGDCPKFAKGCNWCPLRAAIVVPAAPACGYGAMLVNARNRMLARWAAEGKEDKP